MSERAPGSESSDDPFWTRIREWRSTESSPWGVLRNRLVAHTLRKAFTVFEGQALEVLDVGGGDGADAVGLALQGHAVTVLGPSDVSCDRVRRTGRRAGVELGVELLQADLGSLPAAHPGRYDALLCHNVTSYLQDPCAATAALAQMVRPGGLLSLLAPNPAGDIMVAAVRFAEPREAIEVLEVGKVDEPGAGGPAQRVDLATAEQAVEAAGCEVVGRFGIRCVADYIGDDGPKSDRQFFTDLERLEIELCDREPFLRLGRFWQLIVRRV